MGATLRYAKVVDREHLQAHGGLSPATDNLVKLVGTAPAVARDFLILRAWDDVGSGFEEQWHLEDAHGRVVYRGTPRTVLAEHGDIFDELQGVRFEYTGADHQLVLEVDQREVARTDFEVAAVDSPPATADDRVPSSATGSETGNQADAPVTATLSDQEQTVVNAVAQLEASDGPGFAQDIARVAGVDLDTTRAALSRLSGTLDLVQEISTGNGGSPDLGPRYRIKARP